MATSSTAGRGRLPTAGGISSWSIPGARPIRNVFPNCFTVSSIPALEVAGRTAEAVPYRRVDPEAGFLIIGLDESGRCIDNGLDRRWRKIGVVLQRRSSGIDESNLSVMSRIWKPADSAKSSNPSSFRLPEKPASRKSWHTPDPCRGLRVFKDYLDGVFWPAPKTTLQY